MSKTIRIIGLTFSSIKRLFGSKKARYKVLARMHEQHLMEVMTYNLYRFPGFLISFS
ncbi:MAG: hypothetical protein ACMUEL_06040 [Flavobacteriales bacterium Tduv]